MKDFHPCQTCPNYTTCARDGMSCERPSVPAAGSALDGCVCEHLQTTLCGSHYEWCANCGAIRRLGGSRQPLMAWQLPALAEAPQETGPAQPWKGKLHHARTLCDDWGTIRDESGRLILTVMVPPSADIEGWDKYRRNNTDPTQPIVDAILAALNGQNVKDHPLSGA